MHGWGPAREHGGASRPRGYLRRGFLARGQRLARGDRRWRALRRDLPAHQTGNYSRILLGFILKNGQYFALFLLTLLLTFCSLFAQHLEQRSAPKVRQAAEAGDSSAPRCRQRSFGISMNLHVIRLFAVAMMVIPRPTAAQGPAVGCVDDPVCAGYSTTFTQAAGASAGPCATWAPSLMTAVTGILDPPLPGGVSLDAMCPLSCLSPTCSGGGASAPPPAPAGPLQAAGPPPQLRVSGSCSTVSWTVDGPCETSDSCIMSPNYPSNYGN